MSAGSSTPVNIEQWYLEICCWNNFVMSTVKQRYMLPLPHQVSSKIEFVILALSVLYYFAAFSGQEKSGARPCCAPAVYRKWHRGERNNKYLKYLCLSICTFVINLGIE